MGARSQVVPKLVVAEVFSVSNHPKADKLKVCEVDTGVAKYKVREASWTQHARMHACMDARMGTQATHQPHGFGHA